MDVKDASLDRTKFHCLIMNLARLQNIRIEVIKIFIFIHMHQFYHARTREARDRLEGGVSGAVSL
jgi:hypothetical protein